MVTYPYLKKCYNLAQLTVLIESPKACGKIAYFNIITQATFKQIPSPNFERLWAFLSSFIVRLKLSRFLYKRIQKIEKYATSWRENMLCDNALCLLPLNYTMDRAD